MGAGSLLEQRLNRCDIALEKRTYVACTPGRSVINGPESAAIANLVAVKLPCCARNVFGYRRPKFQLPLSYFARADFARCNHRFARVAPQHADYAHCVNSSRVATLQDYFYTTLPGSQGSLDRPPALSIPARHPKIERRKCSCVCAIVGAAIPRKDACHVLNENSKMPLSSGVNFTAYASEGEMHYR